jgi:hypothetical protein
MEESMGEGCFLLPKMHFKQWNMMGYGRLLTCGKGNPSSLYIYIPILQAAIIEYDGVWNNHPM